MIQFQRESGVPGAKRMLTSALVGGLIGFAVSLGLVYLPAFAAGTGTYESTDALFVFTLVLAPLFAAGGLLWAVVMSRPWRVSARVRAIAILAFAVIVGLLWQVFAVLTGGPRLV